MAETLTPNYGWTKPDPGASSNVWGTEINSDLDKIDAQVFTNSQGLNPIGAVQMFAGSSAVAAPANWLFCQGQSLSTIGTYAALFAVVGYAFGGSGPNFNLPNLVGRFVVGVDPGTPGGTTGGEATHVLTLAEMPNHTHVISDPGHTHPIPQTPHNHADPGHTHVLSDPGHSHSATTGAHNHSLNDPGHAHAFTNKLLANAVNLAPGTGFNLVATGDVTGVSGTGITSNTVGNIGVTVDANVTGVALSAAGADLQAANANISITPAVSNVSAFTAGGGAAHENRPPFLGLNYIIRYQ